jgi:hypothetical protein
MKTESLLTLLLTLTTSFLFAHSGVELGPNGGRIVEFSKDETLHGEVIVKDGQFHIALLDKDLKPMAVAGHSLTATAGTVVLPQKLEVKTEAKGFVVPLVKSGDWLILRFKATADAKAITARLHYDTAICSECKSMEWLCSCKPE